MVSLLADLPLPFVNDMLIDPDSTMSEELAIMAGSEKEGGQGQLLAKTYELLILSTMVERNAPLVQRLVQFEPTITGLIASLELYVKDQYS